MTPTVAPMPQPNAQPRAGLVTWIRSLVFTALFYAWTGLAAVLGLPTLMLSVRNSRRMERIWLNGVMALVRHVIGARIEVRGRERVPPAPFLCAAKHQSAWDTMALPWLLEDPAIVMKRELMWIPLYGWYARRWGMIPVDRSAGAAALRTMLRAADVAAKARRIIAIFPQGTRVAPGAPAPYQPGVAALYSRLGLPCVPVAVLSGTVWPRRTLIKRPGTIVFEYLEPIPANLPRARFMALLEERIETASNRLLAESGTPDPVPGTNHEPG